MSTIVFQELQSCLDSQFPEQRTLRLRVAPPKPPPPFSELLELDVKSSESDFISNRIEAKCPENLDKSLSNCFSPCPEKETMNRDPLFHSHWLSPKSLDLCTENLGSESGSDVISEDCFPALSSSANFGFTDDSESSKRERVLGSRKQSFGRSFPPPLTTISGSEPLRIRPHREGGRIVMRAVVAPMTHSCLHAERSHGRLRLCFVKNESSENAEETETEEEEEEAMEEEDMDGIRLEAGDKMGMEKFRRPSRCKGGRGGRNGNLLNWESHLVATS